MRINCVVKPGWILERFAKELVFHVPGVTINSTAYPPTKPSREPLNYYLPMKDVRHMPGYEGIKVGLFTHGEERSELFVDKFDACVTMNVRMAEFLKSQGARRVITIRPGTEAPTRPPVFGVCGRVYGKGRKGAHLVAEAVEAGFHFVACSEKQRGPDRRPPCRITHSIERRSEFYSTIDYLVVTSTDEGGPMPALEAIAHHTPVIAPAVGFCPELPVIPYKRGSWESLHSVLLELTKPRTWSWWARQHERLFEELLKGARAA